MKKICLILLSFLLIGTLSRHVLADEIHIVCDGNIDDYFLDGDYDILNADLRQIYENFGIDIRFVLSKDKKLDDPDFPGVNYWSNAKDNVVLFVGTDGGAIRAGGNHEQALYDNFEYFWELFENESDWKNACVAFYQAIVKFINSDSYEITTPVLDGKSYFYDETGSLSSEEISILNEKFATYSEELDFDIVGVIINNPGNLSLMAYADDFYDYNNFRKDGCLFILSLDERDWWMSTSGRGIDELTDSMIDYIFEAMRPYLANNRYFQAFDVYASETRMWIASPKQADNYYLPVQKDALTTKQRRFISCGGIASVAGVIIGVLFGLLNVLKLRVGAARGALNYLVKDSFRLTGRADHLVRTYTNRTRIERDSGGSSGGGHSSGGSFHTSSSGSSHGGHGGKF